MKVVTSMDIAGTDRDVQCPRNGFTSYRYLIAKDGMGFGLHRTFIPKGPTQKWHYKNHLEACFCIRGRCLLSLESGQSWEIVPGTMYALDKHDVHYVKALEDTVLISVFNPPVTGREVHDADGSYAAPVDAESEAAS